MPLESLQNGRYVPIRRLGSGSMGEVYLVDDTMIGRQVAIKIMSPSHQDAEVVANAVKLFKREARAIARLEHPNILPLYDFGEEKRDQTIFMYMVMPHCSEGSLSDWLQQHRPGPISTEETAYLIEKAAIALQYAHEHGVIHQDVKPSNLLLRPHAPGKLPDLLLADFGIARINTGATNNTTHVGPRGTPRYMSPEQWEGKPVAASDQYALAVTAYQLLAHTFPFNGEQMHQVMYQHIFTLPEPLSKLNPQVSPILDAIILRAMAKKPEDRFPSVVEFAQAFRLALSVSGSMTFSTSVPTRIIDTERTHQSQLPIPPPPNQQPIQPVSYAPEAPAQAQLLLSTPTSMAPLMAEQNRPSLYLQERAAPLMPVSVQQPVQDTSLPLSPPANNWQYAHPSTPRSAVQSVQTKPRSSHGRIALLICLVLLVVLGGTGLGYYFLHIKTGVQANGLTPQPVNNKNPYTSNMTILRYADPLSKTGMWQTETYNEQTHGFCVFQQNAYHASSNILGTYTLCPTSNQPVVNDLTFEVQMQILHGDCGGILFRGDFQNGNFYYFDVCSDGRHYIYAYSNFNTPNQLPTQLDHFPALQSNPQALISVAVVAQGSTITLYMNHQKVDQLSDASYASGQISLFGYALEKPTETVFTNARLWTA